MVAKNQMRRRKVSGRGPVQEGCLGLGWQKVVYGMPVERAANYRQTYIGQTGAGAGVWARGHEVRRAACGGGPRSLQGPQRTLQLKLALGADG